MKELEILIAIIAAFTISLTLFFFDAAVMSVVLAEIANNTIALSN